MLSAAFSLTKMFESKFFNVLHTRESTNEWNENFSFSEYINWLQINGAFMKLN